MDKDIKDMMLFIATAPHSITMARIENELHRKHSRGARRALVHEKRQCSRGLKEIVDQMKDLSE